MALEVLPVDTNKYVQGAEMNAAFAIGRLCDLHTGRVKLLQHKESNLMVIYLQL